MKPLAAMMTLTSLAMAALAPSGPAHAAGAFYLGTWTIAGATTAPWADTARGPDTAERARLTGRTIAFRPGAITGPQPFACAAPHYKLISYGPDMLFQGAFQELHDKDPNRDPARLAAALGFKSPQTQTLETGCEFDFHFVDTTTAEVGLNDTVYTLKRR